MLSFALLHDHTPCPRPRPFCSLITDRSDPQPPAPPFCTPVHTQAHTPRSGSRPRQRPCPSTPTYQQPVPWLESSKAMASVFSSVENVSISMIAEQLYGFEPGSAFDISMPVDIPIETASAFDRNSVNLVGAEGEEDLDLENVNDVFWEELLNEHFDSQDDSGTEAEANFP